MFARIEVALRPEYPDSAVQNLLRKVKWLHGGIREKIRWARLLEVYWLELPVAREELLNFVPKVCFDKVLQWVFTGNLLPSLAGREGTLEDLMRFAPVRPGRFWGIERRFRPGVTDNVGRTLLEAFEIILDRKLVDARVATGNLLLLEGVELDEDSLSRVAREVFCNELIQSWSLLREDVLKKNERFYQVKAELPKVVIRGTGQVECINLQIADDALVTLSQKKLWALSREEMIAIRDYFSRVEEKERRAIVGLGDPTDVELEIFAQTWSEHCKHKIFNSRIIYEGPKEEEGRGDEIPNVIDSLFKTTIAATTAELAKPWLLSAFKDNAGICVLDEEDAFCIKVETHNSPSALDPYAGALTGIVGVNRDILGCGLGAKPIFNTNVFCVAPLTDGTGDLESLPEDILPPRRILDGIRHGVEDGGNKSGIPTVNGALVFDQRYLGKPLVFCGTGGLMPRKIVGQLSHTKEIRPGDRVCMVGGRIGKDGVHGATFSSLALGGGFDGTVPASVVQLGDPLTQKRMMDFLLEARDLGLYRAITDNGAGGLSSSVGEMAQMCGGQKGGASIDVAKAKVKYPGLKPFELLISESQERMTVAVPEECLTAFQELADRRGVEWSDLGEFNESGRFEVSYEGRVVASLDLKFLHEGVPTLELRGQWKSLDHHLDEKHSSLIATEGTGLLSDAAFVQEGGKILLQLLGRPNIASKESMIRQYDHEVQGTSVIKPLHSCFSLEGDSMSGPNDAAVIQPKFNSDVGLAVGCGLNPKLSDIDPYLMAESAVDEAARNLLCVGAEYGRADSVFALVDNFCWPDPVGDAFKTACLVRACYGLRNAALALALPLVSGKDSMKNDYRGDVTISVLPTLLITAVARVRDVKLSRTADFKAVGDGIYLLGPARLGVIGSELQQMLESNTRMQLQRKPFTLGRPSWSVARRVYEWIGGGHWSVQGGIQGEGSIRLQSLHDVSEGGVLTAVSESLFARNLGADIQVPAGRNPWEFAFGEGFHSFIATISPGDQKEMEAEWMRLDIPFIKIGEVTNEPVLHVSYGTENFSVPVADLRSAWSNEGIWE